VTQQYLHGELSALVAGLQPVPAQALGPAVDTLRHRIESGPLPMLPRLVREAMALSDATCWAALEQGDVGGFRRCAETAVALREFAVDANLMR
jgi:hypothetical protein